MSLLNDFARPCVLMEKHREPDGAGGYVTTWTEGAAFSNYQALGHVDGSSPCGERGRYKRLLGAR